MTDSTHTPPTPDEPDAPGTPDAAQAPALRGVSRPARLALVTGALVAAVLVGVWLVRATPWTADAAGRGSDRGIADPGLTLYPAGERDPAPQLEGRTLDDTPFNLEDLRGQVVVINVWGSWCGPCRAETPGLVRIANTTADDGVRFVGIDTRDDRAAAQAFVKNYNVPYPSVFDPTGQALLPFGSVVPSAAIPSTVIVDRNGEVAARVIGAVDENTLAGLIEDLVAEEGTGGDVS